MCCSVLQCVAVSYRFYEAYALYEAYGLYEAYALTTFTNPVSDPLITSANLITHHIH